MRTLRRRKEVRKQGRTQPQIVPDAMAASYVGRQMTFEGVVAAVTSTRSAGMHVLHFGAVHPAETLTVWVPAALQLPAPDRLRGRRVRVTGAVWLYEGLWPAVTLADASALTA